MGPSEEKLDQEFLRSIDRVGVLLRGKRFVEAIEFLRSVIAEQSDLEMRLVYMRNLATVLTLSGQDAESLAVMGERTELAPNEPFVWSGLAMHLLIHACANPTAGQCNEIEVLETVDHAVAAAERAGGAWLRYCLNDRARIAKKIGRWDVFEDSLRRILAIPDGRDAPDIAIEVDFLRNVPPGAVDPDLVERLLAKHAAAMARRNARQD